MTTFGSQLIGSTEKTLTALLRHALTGSGLTEPQWVVLRLAAQHDEPGDLTAFVAEQAHFPDAAALVAGLTDRGLLADGALTPDGTALLADYQARITALTAPVWADLPADDVAAATRALRLVADRARHTLTTLS